MNEGPSKIKLTNMIRDIMKYNWAFVKLEGRENKEVN